MRLACGLILALAAVAAPTEAHHSLTGYDHGRQVTVDGAVTEFRFAHPHPFLFIEAAGQSWRLEMDNLFELDAIGMSKETYRPGDKVQAAGSPGRDNDRTLYLRRLDRPRDGLRYEQIGMSPKLTTVRRQ